MRIALALLIVLTLQEAVVADRVEEMREAIEAMRQSQSANAPVIPLGQEGLIGQNGEMIDLSPDEGRIARMGGIVVQRRGGQWVPLEVGGAGVQAKPRPSSFDPETGQSRGAGQIELEPIGTPARRSTVTTQSAQPGAGADPAAFLGIRGGIDSLLLGQGSPAPPPTDEGTVAQMGSMLDPTDQALGDAMSPHLRDRARKYAANYAAVSKLAGQPGTTQAQISDLFGQLDQQFPEFAGRLPKQPLSSEQAQELQKKIKLSEYQEKVPGVPLDFDDKGNIRIIPGYTEFRQAQASETTAQNNFRDANYKRELEMIREAAPEKPDKGDPASVTRFHEERARNLRAQRELYNRTYGQTAEAASQPAAPAPAVETAKAPDVQMDRLRKLSQEEGRELVLDQDDYDALESGARYIDANGNPGTKR
jgi:hypothetical protein